MNHFRFSKQNDWKDKNAHSKKRFYYVSISSNFILIPGLMNWYKLTNNTSITEQNLKNTSTYYTR